MRLIESVCKTTEEKKTLFTEVYYGKIELKYTSSVLFSYNDLVQ